MKGIVLAGGSGSRLWPMTKVVSKQLLPIHDRPMIYYPISTLMLSGIREFLIIVTPDDLEIFTRLFGNGENLGIDVQFSVQHKPEGIAQAFHIGENFIGSSKVALILGDNVFHGQGLGRQLERMKETKGANIFGYQVNNPQDYGVVSFDDSGQVTSIQEKPNKPISHWAIPGLYFYDNSVLEISKSILPSSRGELEITDINNRYLTEGKLTVTLLERGTTWLDTGTISSYHAANEYVRIVEERQGIKISCLEEIAWRSGWITDEHLEKLALNYKYSNYGHYLMRLLRK